MTSAVNAINFSIEHHCPSCGAPVYLDEADRFFACPYCRVKSCIVQKGFGRYFLTPHEDVPADADLIFMPYWRFKGVQYACSPSGVAHWFTDTSCLAAAEPPETLPFSLGFRTQALKLKRVSARTPGKFLRPMALNHCLSGLSSRNRSVKDALIKEDIGEAVSLIYSPVYQKGDMLFDGILNTPLGMSKRPSLLTEKDLCHPEKETRILSGLCPGCGWDLEGQSDSLVLICRNCDSLWQARDNELAKIRFGAGLPGQPDDVLIPFWKLSVQIAGLPLATKQDLLALANLPASAALDSDPGQKLHFWVPAFKIRPKVFLRISRQVTLAQPAPGLDNKIRQNTHMPITLPAAEAVQSIRLTIASLARPLTDHLPLIASAQIKTKAVSLIFLPFESCHHEFIHKEMNMAINTNVLKLSGNL